MFDDDVAIVEKDTATVAEQAGAAKTLWQAYLGTYLTPGEKQLAEATQKSFDTYDEVRGRVLKTLGAGDFAGGKALAKGEGTPALAALMEDLERTSPQAIVVEHGDHFDFVTGTNDDSAETLNQFPALSQYLAAHYEKWTSVSLLDLYLRRAR